MAALFSPPTHHLKPLSPPPNNSKTHIFLRPTKPLTLIRRRASAENGSGGLATAVEEPKAVADPKKEVEPAGANGSLPSAIEAEEVENSVKFENPKWVNGTWDLTQFQKNGNTDWDAVIDAGQFLSLPLPLSLS